MASATTVLRIAADGHRPVALQIAGFELVVEDGADRGRRLRAAKRSSLIGTHTSSDLVLSDPHVSRVHCRIDVEARDYVLRDLGSTNGTRVNGVRVREACLAGGEIIVVGTTPIRFSLSDTPFEIALGDEGGFEGLLGRSVAMRELYAMLARVAPTDASVLVRGETGTGKDLIAHAIHARSGRAARPIVVFDCGAVPKTLIESELFGHEKGAFTGAERVHAGVFERADGGTVFLDELGELPPDMQPRLLRVLESGEIRRVGGERSLPVDVRVVAATSRDLETMIGDGSFRADLYYRLAVICVRVPPLRERREDIPELAAHFARNAPYGAGSARLLADPAAFASLVHHDWPGNVRELRNVVERAVIMAETTPLSPGGAGGAEVLAGAVERSLSRRVTLRAARDQTEREYLADLLRQTERNLDAAAETAGIHRKSLERLIRKHKLKP